MSTACQAKARRRQAANGYKNLPPRKRPNYKMRSAEASARRLAALIATERRMSQKSKK